MTNVKVLLVDDSVEKIAQVKAALRHTALKCKCDFTVVTSSIAAKSCLASALFDILILDQNLPERDGERPKASEGLTLLREMRTLQRLIAPREVIILTAFELYRTEFESVEDFGWMCIKCGPSDVGWQKQLISRINVVAGIVESVLVPSNFVVDFAVVAALGRPEFEPLRRELFGGSVVRHAGDPREYYEGNVNLGGRQAAVVGLTIHEMGPVAACGVTANLIFRYRPRIVIMAGVAGGVGKDVAIGDIVVADQCWNYDAGKWVDWRRQPRHQPEPKPIPIDEGLRVFCNSLAVDSKFEHALQDYGCRLKPAIGRCGILVGSVVSGSAVVESRAVKERICRVHRKTLALDMEIFGVYKACVLASAPKPIFLAAKAISDLADSRKRGDRWKSSAASVSAAFCVALIREKGAELLAMTR
jgi:nucleoside phosphorylase/CheY-like chemotaxis protein